MQQNLVQSQSKPAQSLSELERSAWLRFIRDRRWSSKQKHLLLHSFTSPLAIQQAGVKDLKQVDVGRWQNRSANVDERRVDKELQWLEQAKHALVVYGSPDYPHLLYHIPDPPLALFAIGDLSLLNDPAVAVVGSRRPTPAGQHLTQRFATGLVDCGISITSGMALGIDGAAHRAALERGGSTIAVMGCGLDIIYPARHRDLFAQIGDSGCLLSEFPLGVNVSRDTFPRRNRLVSGLSLGTLIVEAAERSGTLITARLTMEQNRPVMVIPGSPLSQQYKGSHALLQQGASLVTNIEDVLHELKLPLAEALKKAPSKSTVLGPEQPKNSLLTHVQYEPTSIDSIIQDSGLTAAEVSSMLLTLEIRGLVGRTPDGGVVKLLVET